MSETSFFPGQRWVSNTESELGLGIIVDASNRRVEISFPAAGERRTYAMANAPISRVQYEVGQKISSQDDIQITITEVMDNSGCLIYRGNDEQGKEHIVPELDLNSFVQFSKPQDRLFAGQIDKNRAFELRCETLEHIRHQQQSAVRGLLGSRVQLLPHQLYIASEAGNRYAPRVLLADEVGLGKTIEAGLILHQQLITGRAKRVLVVVPDSLLHQWLVEMLRRFNLFFTILDEQRCQGLEERGDEEFEKFDEFGEVTAGQESDYNPFDSAQLVLCTLSFLTNNQQRLEQAQAAKWDLLIVDEAHHLQWNEQQASTEYQAIEKLAAETRGLLLLTATPEQLGMASHFARLRLLDPDRYYDLQFFIEEEKNHQPVNELVQTLLAEDVGEHLSQQPELLDQLQQYLGDSSVEPLRQCLNHIEIDSQETGSETLGSEELENEINSLVHQLLDRHGTGRVLFRNTRSSVAGFPERKLISHALTAPEILSDQATADVSQQLMPELQMGDSWINQDPRVEWLVNWLKQHRSDKVLVICARAETALALEEYLRLRGGVHSSVFHEGLSLVARDRAAAYFADQEEGAQVLICSEIGSEGRNFQFSHHLVLFDLPLNPDLLEQRIGRLDRIGQRNTVHIHVPFYETSAQQVLLRWYHEGINAFERTCPAGLALYETFKNSLHDCLLQPSDEDSLKQLIEKTQEKTQETLNILQKGRDKLLELNSCNHQEADELVAIMVEEERRQELSSYMEQVFDQYGVDQEHHSAASVVLRPGDHMLTHHFPSLPDDGVTATFSRDVALSREDMHFLSWEHPMVTGAMDMILNGDFGNTAFCTMKLPPLKAGTLLLEAIFTLRCTAPDELQLTRYLPLTTVRVVIDSNGNNLSKVLTPAHFSKLGQKVPKRSAQDLIRHARSSINSMIIGAEKFAAEYTPELVQQAVDAMQTQQGGELQRMKALADVNPNIRQEEITFLSASIEQMHSLLQGAQMKLDAIRVAVLTD